MESAGLAARTLSLAGLVTIYLQLYEIIDAGKKYGIDYDLLKAEVGSSVSAYYTGGEGRAAIFIVNVSERQDLAQTVPNGNFITVINASPGSGDVMACGVLL
ncbi:hypothetical protein BDW62DRAFT_205033 [Aspergillus aurantiobrunneus]